jgi:hypothetical protein
MLKADPNQSYARLAERLGCYVSEVGLMAAELGLPKRRGRTILLRGTRLYRENSGTVEYATDSERRRKVKAA